MKREVRSYLKQNGFIKTGDDGYEKAICPGFSFYVNFDSWDGKCVECSIIDYYAEEDIADSECRSLDEVIEYINKYSVVQNDVIQGIDVQFPENARYAACDSLERALGKGYAKDAQDQQIINLKKRKVKSDSYSPQLDSFSFDKNGNIIDPDPK